MLVNSVGKYSYISIHELLLTKDKGENGEENLKKLLSEFSCPLNKEVENFLKYNAIEFTKKYQSITYLVFPKGTNELVGYFTLALKILSINEKNISNTIKRKIKRVSKVDEETNLYTLPAYLIGQIGKNYAVQHDRISGTELLEIAWGVIKQVQSAIGGIVAFLEAENCNKLLTFYENNHFRKFDMREKEQLDNQTTHYIQLLKIL